jgi:hypothetical protein
LVERWRHLWCRALLEGITSWDRARLMALLIFVYGGFIRGWNSAARQARRGLPSSRRGDLFLRGGQGLSHGCCLSSCSIPRRLAFLATTSVCGGCIGDDDACGNDNVGWLGLQRIVVGRLA